MKITKLIIAFLLLTSIVSCGDKRTRSLQYMPDMYVSVPYDVNGANGVNGLPVNLEPVKGTVSRVFGPSYAIPDTNEGYQKAKEELKSPIPVTDENLENGKAMYTIYCAVCHGKKGDGNGILAQRDKFNGVPNYADRDINQGTIYHVIMYGRGLMGSYASQLTYKERWQVVQYVEKLRNDLK